MLLNMMVLCFHRAVPGFFDAVFLVTHTCVSTCTQLSSNTTTTTTAKGKAGGATLGFAFYKFKKKKNPAAGCGLSQPLLAVIIAKLPNPKR